MWSTLKNNLKRSRRKGIAWLLIAAMGCSTLLFNSSLGMSLAAEGEVVETPASSAEAAADEAQKEPAETDISEMPEEINLEAGAPEMPGETDQPTSNNAPAEPSKGLSDFRAAIGKLFELQGNDASAEEVMEVYQEALGLYEKLSDEEKALEDVAGMKEALGTFENVVPLDVNYSGSCGTGVEWELKGDNTNGYTLTISGTGAMNDYNDSNNLPPWDACRASITGVKIDDNVTKIGSYAFQKCTRLSGINIPNSVTWIGEHAFASTGLTSVVVPDGVTYLGDALKGDVVKTGNYGNVFRDCTELMSATLPADLENIPGATFSGCTKLNESYFKFERYGSLKRIGSNAFYNTGFTMLDLSKNMNLKTIYDGESSGTFGSCKSLQKVLLPPGTEENGVRTLQLGIDTFRDCDSLKEFVFHEDTGKLKGIKTNAAAGVFGPNLYGVKIWGPDGVAGQLCGYSSGSVVSDYYWARDKFVSNKDAVHTWRWNFDDNKHWGKCTVSVCGEVKNEGPHEKWMADLPTDIVSPPNADSLTNWVENKNQYKYCGICGYAKPKNPGETLIQKPVLTPVSSNRGAWIYYYGGYYSCGQGSVSFRSDMTGKYYYRVAKLGESAPPDSSGCALGGGYETVNEEKRIAFKDLTTTDEYNVWIIVKTADGVESEPLKIEVPPYQMLDFGDQTINVSNNNPSKAIAVPDGWTVADITAPSGYGSDVFSMNDGEDGSKQVTFKPTAVKRYGIDTKKVADDRGYDCINNLVCLTIKGERTVDGVKQSVSMTVELRGNGVNTPILRPVSTARIDKDNATATFTSTATGSGKYYYRVVNADKTLYYYDFKTSDMTLTPDQAQATEKNFTVIPGDLGENGNYTAKKVCIVFKSDDGQTVSNVIELPVPPYMDFGNVPEGTDSNPKTVTMPSTAWTVEGDPTEMVTTKPNGTAGDEKPFTASTTTNKKTVEVTFTPGSVGNYSGTVTIKVKKSNQTMTMTAMVVGKGIEAPTLTPKAADRTDIDKGSVTFTSSKNGVEYYYVVVKKGDGAPTNQQIKNSTNNGKYDGETKINLNNLRDSAGNVYDGEYEVYIKVKDGDVWSRTLKIEVPPYLDFGEREKGNTSEKKTVTIPEGWTVQNTSSIATKLNGESTTDSPFTVSTTTDNKTVEVTFRPGSVGNYSGTVTITIQKDGQTMTMTVPMVGTGKETGGTTPTAPAGEAKLDVEGPTFTDGKAIAKPITIINGSDATATATIKKVELTGTGNNNNEFVITDTGSADPTIAEGRENEQWTIKPQKDLPAGTYTYEITVTYTDGTTNEDGTLKQKTKVKPVTFTVTPIVLKPVSSERENKDSAKATFKSDTAGTYYYVIVDVDKTPSVDEIKKSPLSGEYTETDKTNGKQLTFDPNDEGGLKKVCVVLVKDGKTSNIIELPVPPYVDFGKQTVNTESNPPKTITIPKDWVDITVDPPTQQTVFHKGTVKENSDGSKSVDVTFKPTAVTGYDGTVTIKGKDRDNNDVSMTVKLTGEGVNTPVIHPVSSERETAQKGNVVFTSTEPGTYYYVVKDIDDNTKPTAAQIIDGNKSGTCSNTKNNQINVADLSDDDAKKVYIVMTTGQNGTGNQSNVLEMIIPPYVRVGEITVGNSGKKEVTLPDGYTLVSDIEPKVGGKDIDKYEAKIENGKLIVTFTPETTGGKDATVTVTVKDKDGNPVVITVPVTGTGKPVPPTPPTPTPTPEPPKHEHKYTQTKAPTCTTDGEEKCECGETRPLSALKHSWDNGTVTKEPECVVAGEKTTTCTRCGEKKTEPISPIGHRWDNGIITKAPTQTETGVKTYTCQNNTAHKKTEIIAKLNNNPTPPGEQTPPDSQPGPENQTPPGDQPGPDNTKEPEKETPPGDQTTPDDTPTPNPEKKTPPPVSPDAKEIPDSPYDYPTYRDETPDPNDPDSPEIIVVLDRDNDPTVYRKAPDPENDKNMIYMEDDTIPLAGPSVPKKGGCWALLNLIMTIVSVFGGVYALLRYIARKRREKDEDREAAVDADEEEKREKKRRWYILSVLSAVLSVIVFILTENMRLPMVWVDRYTFLMVVLALMQIPGVFVKLRKKYEEEQKKEHGYYAQ